MAEIDYLEEENEYDELVFLFLYQRNASNTRIRSLWELPKSTAWWLQTVPSYDEQQFYENFRFKREHFR